ncbi:hypothetical protein MASR1M31_25100 [Porphyromonadaceae bacterium]
MDYGPSSVIGILGSVAVVGGIALSKRIFSEDSKFVKIKRGAITIAFFIAVLGTYLLLMNVVFGKILYHDKIDKMLTSTAGLELFQEIRKNDRTNYDAILNEITDSTYGKSATDLSMKANNIGREATKKYFSKASSSDIRDYLVLYIRAMNKLLDSHPIVICQLENPQVYGSIDATAMTELVSLGVFDALGKLIKNSISSIKSSNDEIDQAALQEYLAEYQTLNPTDWNDIVATQRRQNNDELKVLAAKYIAFYTKMLEYQDDALASIYRGLRQ